ncbi:Helicase-related_protein [Hexamita inflata]|uniref:Helicase-related_protein n=1 Tax=Hexamita inflata TaxID=28002 RepID=A0ABP1HVQ5_9EUKA
MQSDSESSSIQIDISSSDDVENIQPQINLNLNDNHKYRTLLLLDATLSMDELLQKTSLVLKPIFSSVRNLTKQLEMMVAVYRNYQDGELLFQHSAWESSPDNLQHFLQNAVARGGSTEGQEAIEVGLQFANSQQLNQIILIGDAPPNSKYQIKQHRKVLSEDYWAKTQFKPTHYQDELVLLVNKRVKVHCIYLKNGAKQSFEEIAAETDGECAEMKSGKDVGEQLKEFISDKIGKMMGK